MLMKKRTRYSSNVITPERVLEMQKDFMKKAGPQIQLLVDLMANIPGVSLCIKNSDGRIMFTNRFNAEISGWRSVNDMLGYTSEELYPPVQAAVYAGRDKEVLRTGTPIIERMYGFVADKSDNLNCVTVRPVLSKSGKRIGTATIYWRAQTKMAPAFWYERIRKAVVYMNRHYAEKIPIDELARKCGYSPAQFRRHFNMLMHMSPTEYLTNVRINVAKTLLSTTSNRITDIASQTGFFDHSHFIRSFKDITGESPARYRKRHL